MNENTIRAIHVLIYSIAAIVGGATGYFTAERLFGG